MVLLRTEIEAKGQVCDFPDPRNPLGYFIAPLVPLFLVFFPFPPTSLTGTGEVRIEYFIHSEGPRECSWGRDTVSRDPNRALPVAQSQSTPDPGAGVEGAIRVQTPSAPRCPAVAQLPSHSGQRSVGVAAVALAGSLKSRPQPAQM